MERLSLINNQIQANITANKKNTLSVVDNRSGNSIHKSHLKLRF